MARKILHLVLAVLTAAQLRGAPLPFQLNTASLSFAPNRPTQLLDQLKPKPVVSSIAFTGARDAKGKTNAITVAGTWVGRSIHPTPQISGQLNAQVTATSTKTGPGSATNTASAVLSQVLHGWGNDLTLGQTITFNYPLLNGSFGGRTAQLDLSATYTRKQATLIVSALNAVSKGNAYVQVEGGYKILPSLGVFAAATGKEYDLGIGAREFCNVFGGSFTAEEKISVPSQLNKPGAANPNLNVSFTFTRGPATISGALNVIKISSAARAAGTSSRSGRQRAAPSLVLGVSVPLERLAGLRREIKQTPSQLRATKAEAMARRFARR